MEKKLHILLGQCSSSGIKSINEDSYGIYIPTDISLKTKGIVATIADGMGSCSAAKEASEHCVKAFINDYYSTPDSWSVKHSGTKILTALNNWLYSRGDQQARFGMVTTLTSLVLKSTTGHIFHIGDSRIYRYRNQKLEQLTHDHRVWVSPEKNYLSRAMGIDLHIDIDFQTITLEKDDIFIMTTDGVHDYISDHELQQHFQSLPSDLTEHHLNTIASQIIQQALDKKSHDNITCQIVYLYSLPDSAPNEVYQKLTQLPFPPELREGVYIDNYIVLKELHASATSQLYLVKDKNTKATLVMKTPSVNYQDDPAYIERFQLEEWAGTRISNPHVMKIYKPQKNRQFLYLLTEYIEGQTLRDWIQAHPHPEISDVIALIRQIIQGLRAFHRMDMLHRDLKPDNIIVTPSQNIKIIDFGSVKIAGIEEITTPIERTELLGTKNYTAPEYLLGMQGTSQSDLFSLGIICYEMLTGGKLPYADQLTRQINWRTLNKIHYTPAILYNPMIPLWLDGTLKKATSLDKRTRYEHFSEFLYDLEHPNERFMQQNIPLIERNPLRFWQFLSLTLFILNILLLGLAF